jgi:hypothetical protein
MTTVTTTNPQEAKMAETPQDVRLVLSKLASRAIPGPAPELNGRLLKNPDFPEVYLILNGIRRHVPDEKTVESLFGASPQIFPEFHLNLIDKGDPLEKGATIVKAEGTDAWYLLPGGKVKMLIPTPAVVKQYQFRAATAYPSIVINSIPDGPKIEGR